MFCNTENAASLQKLPDTSNFRKKIVDIIVGNREKGKQNTK